METPQLILLFSGKRKSGKDYICEKIKLLLGEKCALLRISGPLKGLYAEKHCLLLDELMSDGPYKEKYRLDMINWSERVRHEDPGYFCKAACDSTTVRTVWIASDIRRKTDIKWFKSVYGDRIKTVRISAGLDVRKTRGWVYTKGVDDGPSECDLDDYPDWNLEVSNNNTEETEEAINKILNMVEATLLIIPSS